MWPRYPSGAYALLRSAGQTRVPYGVSLFTISLAASSWLRRQVLSCPFRGIFRHGLQPRLESTISIRLHIIQRLAHAFVGECGPLSFSSETLFKTHPLQSISYSHPATPRYIFCIRHSEPQSPDSHQLPWFRVDIRAGVLLTATRRQLPSIARVILHFGTDYLVGLGLDFMSLLPLT